MRLSAAVGLDLKMNELSPKLEPLFHKVMTVQELQQRAENFRSQGLKIVWTNGCFDLLHLGHVQLLFEAASLGDRLLVGINSDKSATRLKGAGRPIVTEQERAVMVAAVSCVDCVTIFEMDSPVEILGHLQPEYYVKGGDYGIDTINQSERKLVESYGGQLQIVRRFAKLSSSTRLNRIRGGEPMSTE